MSNVLLILNYARSGGTLLSKFLSSTPGIILVSEINTQKGINLNAKDVQPDEALKEQLLIWYGIKLEGEGIRECLINLIKYTKERKKLLIIRDWSYNDFRPNSSNNYNPSNTFTMYSLLKELTDFECIAFLRNAIDVQLSLKGNIDTFQSSYLNYIKELYNLNIAIFKYEDLINSPLNFFSNLSTKLSFEFSSMVNLNDSNKVTGDGYSNKTTRGELQSSPIKLKRKYAFPWEEYNINKSEQLIKANNLVGYSTSYRDEKCESLLNYLKRIFMSKFRYKINF